MAASGERSSEDPLAEAIVQGAKARGLELAGAEDSRAVPGHGVEARVEGRSVLLGNEKLMRDRGIDVTSLRSTADTLAGAGETPMYVAVDGRPAGLVACADTAKEDSAGGMARPR